MGERTGDALFQLPTVELSGTWFGTSEEGELCYSLRTRARRRFDDLPPEPHRCICPVLLKNAGTVELPFQKMCLRVDHVALFRSPSRLWASEVHYTFRATDQPGHIDFGYDTPDFEPGCEKLTPARTPMNRSLISRGLSSLRRFSQV